MRGRVGRQIASAVDRFSTVPLPLTHSLVWLGLRRKPIAVAGSWTFLGSYWSGSRPMKADSVEG